MARTLTVCRTSPSTRVAKSGDPSSRHFLLLVMGGVGHKMLILILLPNTLKYKPSVSAAYSLIVRYGD